MTPDPRHPPQERVVGGGLLACALQLFPVILEAQRVSGRHPGIALGEAAGIGEQAHALGRRERVVELAVRTDVEAGLELLLVDRLPAPLALGEDAVYGGETALHVRRFAGAPRVLPPLVKPVPNLYSPPSHRPRCRAPRVPRAATRPRPPAPLPLPAASACCRWSHRPPPYPPRPPPRPRRYQTPKPPPPRRSTRSPRRPRRSRPAARRPWWARRAGRWRRPSRRPSPGNPAPRLWGGPGSRAPKPQPRPRRRGTSAPHARRRCCNRSAAAPEPGPRTAKRASGSIRGPRRSSRRGWSCPGSWGRPPGGPRRAPRSPPRPPPPRRTPRPPNRRHPASGSPP